MAIQMKSRETSKYKNLVSEDRPGKKIKPTVAVNEQQTQLPVRLHQEEFLEVFRRHRTVIMVAETGSGKSTQIPQILLEEGLIAAALRQRLVCTQPRRMAAITLAERVASEVRRWSYLFRKD
jgi:HrpA-like RNA helicase